VSRTRAVTAARLPELVLAALMALAAGVLLHEGRGLTFFGDEWDFILTRRGDGVDDLFDAHVQHFSLVPVVIYRALFELFGIDDYAPYRVATAVLHLLCTGLLFALVRERLGGWAALVAVTPVLFLGRAHEDLIWAFQMGFLAAIATGLGALLALRRGSRAGDVAAALLLCASLASSGVGIAFLVVAAAELAVTRSRGRAWVALAPLAFYALWYVGYGESSAELSNLPDTPVFAATMIAGALGALVGLGIEFGRMALLLGAFGAGREMAARPAVLQRVVPPLCGLLAFAAATGLARADNETPLASRYLYPVAVLLVLVAVAAISIRPPGRRATALAAALAAVAAITNLTPLQDAADKRRVAADDLRASLAGAELARDTAPAGVRLPVQETIDARVYLDVVDAWGSPAYLPRELARRPEGERARADAALLAAVPFEVAPAPGARCGSSASRGRPGEPLDIVLPAGGFTVVPRGAAAVEVRARVFADEFPNAPTATPQRGPVRVVLPAGRPRPPAHVRLTSGDRFDACG
jgi:hypothetical protein